MWFDPLPLLGPGGLAIFFFFFVFLFFRERERDIKAPGFLAYPPFPSTQLTIQTGVSAPTASGGGVLMRVPECLDPGDVLTVRYSNLGVKLLGNE